MAVVRLELDDGLLTEGSEVETEAAVQREREREFEPLRRVRQADDCVDPHDPVQEGSGSRKE